MGTINDLNTQLHDQLTRLNSDIKGDELKIEIERAKAMTGIGNVLVNNTKVALEAIKLTQVGKIHAETASNLIGNNDKVKK
jgi:hypothetical protein